jgi:hypothetical protein
MSSFFDKMTAQDAEHVQGLTRLALELRDNRTKLLKQYETDDEDALLQKITTGQLDEHPTYEHYLSAMLLAQTREAIREDLKNYLREATT